MEHNDYSQWTDQELLDEAKKMKAFSVTNGLVIGFMAGIVFYSIVKNSWGFLTLIPLYIIYRMVNDPRNKKKKALQQMLKERNL